MNSIPSFIRMMVFPEADMEDDKMLDDTPPLQGDKCLLDVVNFPQAYTTSQKFEAQLLKIIHTTGAPNGACHGPGQPCRRDMISSPHHLPMIVKFII
jgi:hypothetical protein